MEAASSCGVTVPLDLLEDNSGRLFSFMQTQTGQCGPKYVLSVMENNPESIHLMRCSLSLLIVTIQVSRQLKFNSPQFSDGVVYSVLLILLLIYIFLYLLHV